MPPSRFHLRQLCLRCECKCGPPADGCVRFGSKGDMKVQAEHGRFATNSGHPAALSQHSNRNRKCRTGLSAIEPSLRQKFWILKICKQRPAPQTRMATGYALDFPAIETREYSPKRRTCRTFPGRMEKDRRDGTGWLTRLDSNCQMSNLNSAFEMSPEFRAKPERTATRDFSRFR
jgi:hypothetical protein